MQSENLLDQPGQIRLLQVRPGRQSDAIECSFLECSLDSPDLPSYQALSYCWGEASLSKSISVAGFETKLTPNLHSALMHLRNRRKTSTLWVDALCINQKDPREKTVQVMQMRWIYQSADQVIVWLGDGTAESQYAMDWLKYGFKYPILKDHTVIKLLQRPWFTRIWVLQEVPMARKGPIVRCGDDEISWSDLRQFQTPIGMRDWVSFLLSFKPLEAVDRGGRPLVV